jgi:hypothetical protein
MSNEDKDLPSDIRSSSPVRASKRTKLAALRRKSAYGRKDPWTWTRMGQGKRMSEKQICLVAYKGS